MDLHLSERVRGDEDVRRGSALLYVGEREIVILLFYFSVCVVLVFVISLPFVTLSQEGCGQRRAPHDIIARGAVFSFVSVPRIFFLCAYICQKTFKTIKQFQSLRRVEKWSLGRQENIQRAAVGPIDCLQTIQSDTSYVFSLPVFQYLTDKRIIPSHFFKKHQTQLTQTLFYGWKARILVQDFQTYIPRQAESYADGPILYFLKDVNSRVRQMHIGHTSIFKNGPYICLIESKQRFWFGPTPCQYPQDIQSFLCSESQVLNMSLEAECGVNFNAKKFCLGYRPYYIIEQQYT